MDDETLILLKELRRELHRFPDLSGNEEDTCLRLSSFLQMCGPDEVIHELGGGGMAVIFNGKEDGPDLMFRAETDGVPITEDKLFTHASRKAEVSHKCGHDGHMSILAGVAASLIKRKIRKGRLILLFQPAEETGTGAQAVLKDKKFKSLLPDYVFALHNWPGFPHGSIVLKEGVMFAASAGVCLEFRGESSHAMAPEEGISPVACIKAIDSEKRALFHPDRQAENFSLITTVGIQVGGDDFGVSPGAGTMYLTARAYKDQVLKEVLDALLRKAGSIAEWENLAFESSIKEPFASAVNDPQSVSIVRRAADSAGLPYLFREQPLASSEDVGELIRSARRGGAVFLLGSGEESAPLHSRQYDFDDRLIEPGLKIFLQIADDLLGFEPQKT